MTLRAFVICQLETHNFAICGRMCMVSLDVEEKQQEKDAKDVQEN